MPRNSSTVSLAMAVALVANTGSEAAEWVAEPSVTVRGEFNDNIRLTNAPHDNVWSATLDPRIRLSRRSELWDLNAKGRVRSEKFNEDNFDATDNYFDLAALRKFERGSFDASASLINDTTLQTEELDLDTGLVTTQVDRQRVNYRVAGRYRFTETMSLEAAFSYATTEYDDGERYGLLDYDYLTPQLTLIRQLNPQTQIYAVLGHARVEYNGDRNLESKTNSINLGAAYDLTEVWKIDASIGARKTDTSETVIVDVTPNPTPPPLLLPVLGQRDSNSTGLVYSVSATRKFQTGSIGVSASQSVQPSSSGTDTETAALIIDGSRRFSARLSGRLSLSYRQSSSVGDVRTRADNDRYRVEPSLTWQMDESTTLSGGYRYTRVDRGADTGSSVDSNAAYVNLQYNWPRIAVSR